MSNPVSVFFIYARQDQNYKKRIVNNLTPLIQNGTITVWNDEDILPGANWENEIAQHLSEADIILALVSEDFLASSYIQSKELIKAFERYENKEVEIIPIILRACLWEENPRLKTLQALPDEGKAVNNWSPEDNAYRSIALGVQAKINEVFARKRLAEEEKIAHAKEVLQQKEWEYAQNKGTVTAYREYVERFQPDHLRQEEVLRELGRIKEEIDYAIACVRNTPEAYDTYLKAYQKSRPQFEQSAKERIQNAKAQPGKVPSPSSVGAKPAPGDAAEGQESAHPSSSTWAFPDWAKHAGIVAAVGILALLLWPRKDETPLASDPSEQAWAKAKTKKDYEAYQYAFPNGQRFQEAGDSIQAIQRFSSLHIQKAKNVRFSPEDAKGCGSDLM